MSNAAVPLFSFIILKITSGRSSSAVCERLRGTTLSLKLENNKEETVYASEPERGRVGQSMGVCVCVCVRARVRVCVFVSVNQ